MTSKRKSTRKWRPKWIGKRITRRKYADDKELHAYEEHVVLRVMRERDGFGDPHEWWRSEPERWNRRLLNQTFLRLENQCRVTLLARHVTRINFHATVHARYATPERVAAMRQLSRLERA
jgi:hypothetical protein